MDPLQKTISFRPKQDAVKQEVDRNEDMIRSSLRAIAALNRTRYRAPYCTIYISFHMHSIIFRERKFNLLLSLLVLSTCSGGDCSHKFKNLMNEIGKSQTLWDKFCSIRNE